MIVPRETRDGRTRYGVRVYDAERDRVRWIGTYDELGSTRKRGTARWAEAQANKGSKSRSPFCDAFARSWLEARCPRLNGRPLKDSSLAVYQQGLKPFIRDFEGVRLRDVTRKRAAAWVAKGVSRSVLAATRQLFTRAYELDLVDHNPFRVTAHGVHASRPDVTLTEADVFDLADAALKVHGEYGPTFRAFIIFQAFTRLRPGETYALRWADIDVDARQIYVSRTLSKVTREYEPAKTPYTVPLPPTAETVLRDLPRGADDLLFHSKRGQPLTHPTVDAYWWAVRKKARQPNLPLYGLRNLAA